MPWPDLESQSKLSKEFVLYLNTFIFIQGVQERSRKAQRKGGGHVEKVQRTGIASVGTPEPDDAKECSPGHHPTRHFYVFCFGTGDVLPH